MKRFFFAIVVFFGWMASSAQSQETDVFIDVRGDRLHFHILRGNGVPILFEAGGGDDGTVWTNIAKPVGDITGATLITYDRAGFGRSELNANEQAIDKHGIQNGVEELEAALTQLSYNGNIMLVAHSYGAFYATLYAARHPTLVKAAVLIDGSSACWFTNDWIKDFVKERQSENKPKADGLGNYYQSANLPKTVEMMRKTIFPPEIPVIDLVSENPPFSNKGDVARWKRCHQQFANAQANREGLTAYGSGHYIFKDNTPLVVHAIIKAYISMLDRREADEIMRRHIDYAIDAANQTKRQQVAYQHSELDLNSWGYALLGQGETTKAIEVFRLNATLHPESADVFAALAEAYEAIGQKELAISNYKYSLKLNPGNKNAEEHLKKLSSPNNGTVR